MITGPEPGEAMVAFCFVAQVFCGRSNPPSCGVGSCLFSDLLTPDRNREEKSLRGTLPPIAEFLVFLPGLSCVVQPKWQKIQGCHSLIAASREILRCLMHHAVMLNCGEVYAPTIISAPSVIAVILFSCLHCYHI